MTGGAARAPPVVTLAHWERSLMFVKVKRGFFDDMGQVNEGQVVEVSDEKGKDLIRLGLVTNIQEGGPQGTGGPISSGTISGPTGAIDPSSSSPAAQAPQQSTSNVPAVEPASFASTTGTGSADGPTLFTDATAPGGRRKRESRRSKE